MAKAKEISGLDCGANAVDWAEKVLRIRFAEVCELREGALNFSDTEGVHAMRVATRRLRSALGDFQPLLQKRPLRGVKKHLKLIARALGSVRDQDVAIVKLEKLQKTAPNKEIKEQVESFLSERRAERDEARLELTNAIDEGSLVQLQEQFSASIKPKSKKHLSEPSFNEAGRQAVSQSLDEFYRLGENLYAPFAVEKLHEMRIAAKQLRYVIELFTACWGKKIEEFAEQIALMQDVLGEVHDYDVWIESLSEHLRNDQDNKKQAAIWLLSKFTKKRTSSYLNALEIWSKWQTDGFDKSLQSVIDSIV